MKNPLTRETRNAFDPYQKRWFELTTFYAFGFYLWTLTEPKRLPWYEVQKD